MADRELEIVIRAVATELKSGLDAATSSIRKWGADVREEITGVEEHAEGLKNVFKDAFEAFVGVEIVDQLRKIAEAASEASDTMEIAANTARNLGHEADAALQEEWLEKFARSAQGGGFAMTELRQAMESFASVGANMAQQQRLTADAAGLAAMKNISLAEATRILTLAASGHVEMLSRYGINTKDAEGKTVTFTAAMQQLERAMNGDAAIRANGLAGALGRLGDAANKFVAGPFGQEIQSLFTGAVNAATRFVDAINALPAGTLQAAAAIGTAVASLTALTLIEPAISLVSGVLGNTFTLLLTPLRIIGTTAALAFEPFAPLAAAAVAAIGTLLAALGELAIAFAATAAEGAGMVAGAMAAFIASMAEATAAAAGPMIASLGSLAVGFATAGARALVFVAGPMAGVIRSLALSAALIGGTVLESIGAAIAGIGGMVVELGAAALAWGGEAIAAVAAAVAPILPIAALIAAIVGIIAIIVGVATHWEQFSKAAKIAIDWVGGAVRTFVAFAKDQFSALGTTLGGVWKYLSGDEKGGIAAMQSGLAKIGAGWKGVGSAIFSAVKTGGSNALAFIEKRFPQTIAFIKAKLGALFGSTVGPSAGPNNASLEGLGGAPAKGPDEQKGINDALAQAKANIQAALDAALARVENAKVALDSASTSVDSYKDSLPDGKAQTLAQAIHLQQLEADEVARERDLQAELIRQKQAYLTAAQQEAALARSLPAADKDRVTHAIELNKQAREYTLNAAQTGVEIQKTMAAIAKLGRDMGVPFREVMELTQQIATDAARADAAVATRAIRGQQETLRLEKTQTGRQGANTASNDALFADREQQLDVALAKIAEDLAKRELELARENPYTDPAALAAAQDREVEAHEALSVAVNNERIARETYTDELRKSQLNLTNVIDTVASTFAKLVPGLTIKQNDNGSVSAIFDWSTLLGDIIQKSKAYADVQNVVNQVVKVAAQIFDALRPVIDGLLKAFAFFANIVIDVYNVFARLLRIFGISIPILDQINTNFAAVNNSPLISIIHDLPTQNELATGKVGTLSTTPIDVSKSTSWNAPITNALSSPTLGGGLLGVLGELLGAMIAVKEILAAVGIGSGLNSGGGGIGGFFSNLFHLGSSSSSGAGVPDIGNASFGDWGDDSVGADATVGDADDLESGAAMGPDAAAAMQANTDATSSLTSAISSDSTSSTSGGLSGAMGKVSEGLGVAAGAMEVFKGLSKGGTFAQTLGGAGTIVGSIFGGPLGATIGQFLGTAIGGLFGPKHSGSMPDENDPNFGNEEVGLTGKAFGTAKYGKGIMDSAVSSLTGGQGLLPYIQSYLASGGAGLSDAVKAQLTTEFGTSGSGKINYGHNIEDESVAGGKFSGNYQDLWKAAVAAAQQISEAMSSAGSSFSGMVASAQPIVQSVYTLGNQLTASAGALAPTAAASSTAQSGDVTIRMGDINVEHMHGVDDVRAISEAQAEETQRVLRSRPYLVSR